MGLRGRGCNKRYAGNCEAAWEGAMDVQFVLHSASYIIQGHQKQLCSSKDENEADHHQVTTISSPDESTILRGTETRSALLLLAMVKNVSATA